VTAHSSAVTADRGAHGCSRTLTDVAVSPNSSYPTRTLPDGTLEYPNDLRVLPDGTEVSRITVRWPDGTVVDENGNMTLPSGAELPAATRRRTAPPGPPVVDGAGNRRHPDGRVEYTDGSVGSPDGTRTLANGTKVYAGGRIEWPDGAVYRPYGPRELADGTREWPLKTPPGLRPMPDIWPKGTFDMVDAAGNEVVRNLRPPPPVMDDGTIVYDKGPWVRPDGTILIPDGATRVLPNRDVVLPNGDTIRPDGIRVLANDALVRYVYPEYIPEYPPQAARWRLTRDERLLPEAKAVPRGRRGMEGPPLKRPDGTKWYPDGRIVWPSGVVILPDGSRRLANGRPLPPPTDDPQATPIVDRDGTTVYPYQRVEHPDGTVEAADGTRTLANGIKVLPGGRVEWPNGIVGLPGGERVFPDGTRELPGWTGYQGPTMTDEYFKAMAERRFRDGVRVHPDGTKTYRDSTREYPDGTRDEPAGVRVYPDGTRVLSDGTRVLPDLTRVSARGKVTLPDGKAAELKEPRTVAGGVTLHPDGGVVQADGGEVLPDGTRRFPDGTLVLRDTVTRKLPDGTILHPDGTRIPLSPPPAPSPPGERGTRLDEESAPSGDTRTAGVPEQDAPPEAGTVADVPQVGPPGDPPGDDPGQAWAAQQPADGPEAAATADAFDFDNGPGLASSGSERAGAQPDGDHVASAVVHVHDDGDAAAEATTRLRTRMRAATSTSTVEFWCSLADPADEGRRSGSPSLTGIPSRCAAHHGPPRRPTRMKVSAMPSDPQVDAPEAGIADTFNPTTDNSARTAATLWGQPAWTRHPRKGLRSGSRDPRAPRSGTAAALHRLRQPDQVRRGHPAQDRCVLALLARR
jgi:hypothetical protein